MASTTYDAPPRSGRAVRRVAGLFHGGPQELLFPKERRNPYLDGLRTIAVLLVVNHHVASGVDETFGSNAYTRFQLTQNGWIGVDLFFVLSGFFIGSQLWRELDGTGTVSLGKFMIRRGLRIWPLYFFVFALAALLSPTAFVARQHGWSDLVFLTNYLNHGIVLGGWSLCSEEQFYLLAPLMLLLFGRQNRRRYRWGLTLVFIAEYAVRAGTYYAHAGHLFVRDPAAFQYVYYPFHTHCDGLIAGLLIANWTATKNALPKAKRPELWVLAGAVLLVAGRVIQPETLDFTGLAVFFGALVWWGTQRNIPVFNSRLFYVVSRLSFGMYLLHPYMVSWTVGTVEPVLRAHIPASAATALGFLILATVSVLVSSVTFCLVEHPFLNLRTAILSRRVKAPLVAT